jgi:hypothetical protein
MSSAEVALSLPEETKKVTTLVAYSDLEVQEIIANSYPEVVSNLMDDFRRPDATVDEKVKIARILHDIKTAKTKQEDKTSTLPTISITINRRGAPPVQATVIDVPSTNVSGPEDPDDPDDDFLVSITPVIATADAQAINMDVIDGD